MPRCMATFSDTGDRLVSFPGGQWRAVESAGQLSGLPTPVATECGDIADLTSASLQ